MASFSRGLGLGLLLLAPRAPLAATQPLQPFSQRLFSSLSPLRFAAKPPAKPTRIASAVPRPPKPAKSSSQPTTATTTRTTPSSAPVTAPRNPSTYATVTQLAQRSSPTLLYEAASHFWMKLSAWGAMIMFYSYAIINYYTMLLHPPEDIAAWVPHAFAVICLAMAGFGSYFIAGAHNIVKTIRAVPTAALAKNGTLPAGANPKTTPIHLEITVKRTLPGRTKTLLVAPDQVSMPGRIYNLAATPYPTPAQERAASRQRRAEARAKWEYDREHLMTVPFRDATKGFKAAWYGISRAVTKAGFMKMQAGKEKLKLDVTSGWALDDGRVIDRLVKIES
ncbi:hypothetical protein CCHL11_03457 [Colletotrichum chlorophyti]|uniref:Uncharacterized protein n=1 Tax=Colletotrichum chlorophyti TaxID=708187 RepID=A0A1Q8S010_9PEZI|nr:hypothetical protein CCHL11_03457 [Colletotrichum chlorophyti]